MTLRMGYIQFEALFLYINTPKIGKSLEVLQLYLDTMTRASIETTIHDIKKAGVILGTPGAIV